MIDAKTKNWIIKILSDMSYKRPEYAAAKNRAKIGTALFRCELCSVEMYEGTSQKRYLEYLEKYPNVRKEKPELDHINPRIDPDIGWQGFDVYIERSWCSAEGLQVLCKACHQSKTLIENKGRVVTRKGAKRGKNKTRV
jgi:5-methylcytosine-specific restriction endonuclease McrA